MGYLLRVLFFNVFQLGTENDKSIISKYVKITKPFGGIFSLNWEEKPLFDGSNKLHKPILCINESPITL